MEPQDPTFVVFVGAELVARGPLADAAVAARRWHDRGTQARIAVFDEESGQPTDIPLHGAIEEIVAKLEERPKAKEPGVLAGSKGPGRPKLGVVSREVSLLPRHWSWLSQQRGGASAALRRLVDGASKASGSADAARRAVEAAHRFMWDMAGDLPGFEEATRSLFAHNFDDFDRRIAPWPAGIREQLRRYTDRARLGTSPEEAGPRPEE